MKKVHVKTFVDKSRRMVIIAFCYKDNKYFINKRYDIGNDIVVYNPETCVHDILQLVPTEFKCKNINSARKMYRTCILDEGFRPIPKHEHYGYYNNFHL